ncbi:MAG: VOC family protein [Armatimonadota bacterium]
MRIHPYLSFPGTCEEAFAFYAQLFDGQVTAINRYGDGSPFSVPDGWGVKVIHAELVAGGIVIYGSDHVPEMFETPQGFSLSWNVTEFDAGQIVFDALAADGGTVVMPFSEVPWSIGYGMVKDRFGITWQINVDSPTS